MENDKENEEIITPQQLSQTLFESLDWVGCNPTNQTTARKFLWFINLCAMLFWFFTVLMFNYCCYIDFSALTENIMYLAIILQVVIKFFICRIYARMISNLLEVIFAEFWNLDNITDDRIRAKYIFLYRWLGFMIKHYKNIFIISILVIILETLHTDPTKPVTDVYTPSYFDVNNEQPYAIIIMITQLGTVCGCVILTLVPYDGIFTIMVGSAYVQLVCLDLTLRALVCEPDTVEEAKKTLAKCVKHHNFIIQYLKKVEEVYSLSMMFQLTSLLLTICLSLYQVSTDEKSKLRPILYATLSAMQLFIYCLGGQIITDQSLAISDAVYHCDWWRIHDKSFRGAIIMIIQRSQRQVDITAGNLYVLSMDLFMSVLRASGSFVTLLQSMQD